MPLYSCSDLTILTPCTFAYACRGKPHFGILYHTQDTQIKALSVARCASTCNLCLYAGTHRVGIYNVCSPLDG